MSGPLASVYVASKTRHASDWRIWRNNWWDMGLAITSTWIDHAEQGDPVSMSELWPRIFEEVRESDFLIAFHRPGDAWKGVYAEVGAALVLHKPVYFCGLPEGTLHLHPLVTLASDPDDAVEHFRASRLRREWY